MQQIKFVLWERYRAWWGAHQLNEKDPFLLDRLKEQKGAKNLGMTISQYRQHRVKMERQAKIAAAKREVKMREREKQERIAAQKEAEAKRAQGAADIATEGERKAKEKLEQEQKDAAMMEMYQKLAVGGGSAAPKAEQAPEPTKPEEQRKEEMSPEDNGLESEEDSQSTKARGRLGDVLSLEDDGPVGPSDDAKEKRDKSHRQ